MQARFLGAQAHFLGFACGDHGMQARFLGAQAHFLGFACGDQASEPLFLGHALGESSAQAGVFLGEIHAAT
jgi:hypothetical protein